MKSVPVGYSITATPANAAPRVPLPTADDPRLARALEEYQAALDAGTQLDRHELLARYSDIAEKLAECLEGLEFVHTVATQLQEPDRAPGTPPAEVWPGLPLGDYRIIREIGRGGMGVVYEAEQQALGRRVALKVLLRPAAQDAKVLARFRRESRAAAQLHHSNIVPVFDVGQQGDICYYAMQFIRGQALDGVCRELLRLRADGTPGVAQVGTAEVGSLAQSLWTGAIKPAGGASVTRDHEPGPTPAAGPEPPPAATAVAVLPERFELSSVASNYQRYCRIVARLGLQVAEALAYAHARGIIHRDIKPANLLLDSTGILWVSDFGLAKTQDAALTDTGDLVGTLRYMAPERFRGECDARADVYALGLTLYELLVLRPAFDGTDRLHLVDQIGHQEPARLRALDPRIPRDLETILMKAIEKDPRRRYASADDLAEDLGRYLADEPIRARQIGPLERLGRWGRRNPLVAGLIATVVLVTALGFAGVFGQMQVALANEGRANAHAALAEQQKQEAKDERDEAQRQRDEVRALNEQLRATQAQLRGTLYAAHMNLAHNAWVTGGTARVRELLDQHRPKPGETDLRGFEWHYLYRLCHAELLTLKGHTGGVNSVAYSPDGKRLASGSGPSPRQPRRPGEVRVWDAQSGQELLSLKGGGHGVAFSPDGKRLASGSGESPSEPEVPGEVKVWDAQSGQELLILKGGGGGVAFSPDGQRLASASRDRTVKVWDAQSGQELLTLKGGGGGVAFSPDGKRLASANHTFEQGKMGGEVKVWDAQTGQELLTLKEHTDQIYSVAFSSDGKRLASASQDGTVKVWDAQTGQELLTFKGNIGSGYNVAFSPDGKRLAKGYGPVVRVWDAQTGQELLTFKGHTSNVRSVAFSPDGKRLALAGGDGTVEVWDATTSQEARTLSGHTSPLSSVAFSPDGKRLASTAYNDLTVRVWDAQTGQETLTFQGHTLPVTSVAFSPDGKRLAGASRDRTVKVWDAQTGQELLTLKGGGGIYVVAFSPDGKRLASGSSGPGTRVRGPGQVKVWDAQTGQELLSLQGHTDGVRSVAYSPDGKRLASASRDNMVKVWDAQTGQELLTFEGGGGSMAFSPDGKRLARGSQVWDAQTGQELLTLQGGGWVVAFSPDGKRLAGGDRGEVKVWDAQTGQELLTLQGGDWVAATLSPDGHRLASGSDGGTVKIWDATPLPAKP